jgi:hypothetical protein
MIEPEQALERARQEVASMRAAGAYPESVESGTGPPLSRADDRQLLQWALLDPDVGNVHSMRRFGAPVTALKRLLLRLLAQYHQELIAEQTRFNVALLERVRGLERRIEELERHGESRQTESSR